MFSCQEAEPELNPVSFEYKVRIEGENAILINWDQPEAGTSLRISISKSESFVNPLSSHEVAVSDGTIRLSGLTPMTAYFLLAELKDEEKVIWSESSEFTSGYTTEMVSYASTDEVQISAKLAYVSTALSPGSRTVIFMHEFTRTKTSWNASGILDSLVRDGNLCLAFDFRGHGSSIYGGDVVDLIEKPWMAREDFDATLDYLEGRDLKRSGEIIVFGASIGACVATSVSSYPEVIGGIAASPVEFLSRDMTTGILVPRGMFYIAGELDKNVSRGIDFGIDAISLSAQTEEPTMVLVMEGAAEHGVDLLESYPELIPEALQWVRDL
jgi:pimeloyl-ACP methyl ester carboxylesterase